MWDRIKSFFRNSETLATAGERFVAHRRKARIFLGRVDRVAVDALESRSGCHVCSPEEPTFAANCPETGSPEFPSRAENSPAAE